ncbi:FmdB family zinc ribbon protein [candidate division CSSED10-310 bacterium]|uniref:FmdB family zinc ribbon protein n=1 Tax=candidate division CSSED10-310 bacterium TaxID=2855610 RepID=A0ABV6YXM7_UNCC1
MPTYEYRCSGCGFRFERFQKMSDEPVKNCPLCSESVEKIIGAGSGFIIKGASARSQERGYEKDSCQRETPCCGRETRCDTPPCS